MILQARKLHPLFAAEITGMDMRRDTDADTVAALIAALDDYAVCVVPHETPLSNDEHWREAILRCLGEDALDLSSLADNRNQSLGGNAVPMGLGDFFFSPGDPLHPDTPGGMTEEMQREFGGEDDDDDSGFDGQSPLDDPDDDDDDVPY